jgi:hypothetical protein
MLLKCSIYTEKKSLGYLKGDSSYCNSISISFHLGVLQGSHLGPSCFIWFVNRISVIFDYVRVLFYADDMELYVGHVSNLWLSFDSFKSRNSFTNRFFSRDYLVFIFTFSHKKVQGRFGKPIRRDWVLYSIQCKS